MELNLKADVIYVVQKLVFKNRSRHQHNARKVTNPDSNAKKTQKEKPQHQQLSSKLTQIKSGDS